MTAIDRINDDLGWREGELASLRLLLFRGDITKTQRDVLLRAAWALLYAHYEGFVKTALTVFYDFAQRSGVSCGSLPVKTRLNALENTLKAIRSLPSEELLTEIERFTTTQYSTRPRFKEVDTQSNLWPATLEELLSMADISIPAIETHRIKLRTLVSRRNEIAHGKQDVIKEVDYYISYETIVYEVMYEIAFAIDRRLSSPPYS